MTRLDCLRMFCWFLFGILFDTKYIENTKRKTFEEIKRIIL